MLCGADTQVRPYTCYVNTTNPAIKCCNPNLRRGGPMCPPVLVGALYALRADTQVRPYTSYVSTTIPLIKRCNPDLRRNARSVRSLHQS